MYLYKVYNLFGEQIAQGTTKECAAQLGMKETGFRAAVDRMRAGICRSMVIEEFEYMPDSEIILMQDAAAKWDAFITPIREQYGVPVYKAKGEAGR